MIPAKAKPKRIYQPQVHIIHSMIHMVKNKMKHERWMQPRDFVEANVWKFDKMGEALKEKYNMNYLVDHAWEAAGLYMEVLKNDE